MTDYASEVAPGWWRHACELIHFPIACIDTSQKFVWANESYERLIGYSLTELRAKRWTEVTVQADVGGDLASIEAVQRGDRDSYTLSKRYCHKLGHSVPVTITVWRFPDGIAEATCFVVEAAPKTATHFDLENLRIEMLNRMETSKKDHTVTSVTVGDTNQGDNAGLVKALTAIVAILALLMVYVIYYLIAHGQAAPSIPGITP